MECQRVVQGRSISRGVRRSLRNLVVWSIVALGASSGPTVIAAEDPRANPAAAAPAAAAEPAAVKFTRSDLERWTAQAKVLTDAAAQAAAALEAANKAVADAKAALTAADKAIAEATAAITAAEPAKVATEKALVAAQEELKKVEAEKKDDADAINAAKTAVAAAQTAADTAAKQLAEAQAKKKQGEETKATATKQIPEFEAVIKPRTEAKAAADKLAAEAQVQIKTSQDRLTVLGQGKVQPDPTATRLIQTVTHDRPLLACKFDAAGQYLLAGAEDSLLHRWDLVTNSAVHLKGHRSWIGTMAPLNPTTSVLVTGGHEGKLAWWNALDPAPAPSRIIDAHKGYIRAVAVSPNGLLIATGGNDNMVRVWSAADGTLVKELAGHPRHVYNVAFHPSGTALISGDLMGGVKQWDVATWTMTREFDGKLLSKYDAGFKADVGGIRTLEFSPDGKILAAGGITDVSNAFAGVGNPLILLFDWESGKLLRPLRPKEAIQGSVWGMKFHPSGEFLIGAGGGGAGAMWFWKTTEEPSFYAMGLPSVAYDLALHPDGLRLAVPLFDKTLRIYDMSAKLDVAAK